MKWSSIGFPEIPGLGNGLTNSILSFAGSQLTNLILGEKWGIYNQNGIPLLLVDSVETVEYSSSSQVSQYPIEAGGFGSLNKVSSGFDVSVSLIKSTGGTVGRSAFLSQIEALANSTSLFTIVTPETVYTNCAITGYSYLRAAGGTERLIRCSLTFREIRLVQTKIIDLNTEQGIKKTSSQIASKLASVGKKVKSAFGL